MSATWIILLCTWLAAMPVLSQTIGPADKASPPADSASAPTNHFDYRQVEAVRAKCIQGRRIICGKIIKVLPEGLVVDSGYTNLMREPLNHSWLIPGTAEAERATNLVEKDEPDCVCVGLVFLTDPPKSRKAGKPKALDYVVLQAFPAGQFTYNSAGTVQRTVRHFSGSLSVAERLNLKAEQK